MVTKIAAVENGEVFFSLHWLRLTFEPDQPPAKIDPEIEVTVLEEYMHVNDDDRNIG